MASKNTLTIDELDRLVNMELIPTFLMTTLPVETATFLSLIAALYAKLG